MTVGFGCFGLCSRPIVGLKRCKSAFKWTWVPEAIQGSLGCFCGLGFNVFSSVSAEFWCQRNPVVLLRCISATSSASAKFCSSVGDAKFSRQFGFAWWTFARSTMQSASRVTCEMAGSLVRLYRLVHYLACQIVFWKLIGHLPSKGVDILADILQHSTLDQFAPQVRLPPEQVLEACWNPVVVYVPFWGHCFQGIQGCFGKGSWYRQCLQGSPGLREGSYSSRNGGSRKDHWGGYHGSFLFFRCSFTELLSMMLFESCGLQVMWYIYIHINNHKYVSYWTVWINVKLVSVFVSVWYTYRQSIQIYLSCASTARWSGHFWSLAPHGFSRQPAWLHHPGARGEHSAESSRELNVERQLVTTELRSITQEHLREYVKENYLAERIVRISDSDVVSKGHKV